MEGGSVSRLTCSGTVHFLLYFFSSKTENKVRLFVLVMITSASGKRNIVYVFGLEMVNLSLKPRDSLSPPSKKISKKYLVMGLGSGYFIC